jgi:hypothetical protein
MLEDRKDFMQQQYGRKPLVITWLMMGWVLVAPWTFAFAGQSIEGASIILDQPVQFMGVDGSEALVEAGTYGVEPAEGWLRLVPGERRDAILVEAEPTVHSEQVDVPRASIKEIDGVGREVVLLLPNGKGLKASGIFSGIQSRGLSARNSVSPRQEIGPISPTGGPVVSGKNQGTGVPNLNPDDPWDKLLLTMIQTLIGRVNALEKELGTLNNHYAKHEHDYELPKYGEGGMAWVTIRQLRKMEEDEGQSIDNYGVYFRGKGNSSPAPPWLAQTSGPKN